MFNPSVIRSAQPMGMSRPNGFMVRPNMGGAVQIPQQMQAGNQGFANNPMQGGVAQQPGVIPANTPMIPMMAGSSYQPQPAPMPVAAPQQQLQPIQQQQNAAVNWPEIMARVYGGGRQMGQFGGVAPAMPQSGLLSTIPSRG